LQNATQLFSSLRIVALGMAVAVAPTPALARSAALNEPASAAADATPAEYEFAPAPVFAVPDAPLPQKPVPAVRVKVIDRKFIAVMGGLGATESLRFTTHTLVLDHEFAAGAPWVTQAPVDHRLVTKYGAIYAAELLVAYELKKPHAWLPGDKVARRLWWAYPAAMAPIHMKNAVRSIRTQAPSGCPVQLCGPQ
jgi:hypothetical protein